MCKVIVTTSHNPKKLKSLISEAWGYFNRTGESDGFGAVWISRSGNLCWLKSSSPEIESNPPHFCTGFADSEGENSPSNGGFLLIHGRKATCAKTLENTHPMLGDGSALIHNGVVRSASIENKDTTCDSELLLIAMRENNADRLAEITGYFAFGMIQKTESGKWCLHVGRDDTARLVAGRNDSGGYTFATTAEAAEIAGCAVSYTVRPWSLITFSGATKHTCRKIAKPAPVKVDASPRVPHWMSDGDRKAAFGSDWPMRHTTVASAQAHMFSDETQDPTE